MLMSALAEEKGGKSEKMPTSIVPALLMSANASAEAEPAKIPTAAIAAASTVVSFRVMVMVILPFR